MPKQSPLSSARLAVMNVIAPGAYKVLGIPIRQGRDFDEGDRSSGPHVVMVDPLLFQTLALPDVLLTGRLFSVVMETSEHAVDGFRQRLVCVVDVQSVCVMSAPDQLIGVGHPRVLLADDHAMLLDAFTALLAPEFDVVGTVTDGRKLLAEFDRLHPDVVVLDIAMPLLNGLDAGKQLMARHSPVKLIYLTMNPDPDLAGEALRLGASGYVLKSSAAHELKQAIHEAVRGRSYITPLITRDVVGSLIHQRHTRADLTTRQREVLQLLAEGHSMKEVGAILNLTPRTVAFHKYRMMEQLRLKTSAELVQFAVRQGLVA